MQWEKIEVPDSKIHEYLYVIEIDEKSIPTLGYDPELPMDCKRLEVILAVDIDTGKGMLNGIIKST